MDKKNYYESLYVYLKRICGDDITLDLNYDVNIDDYEIIGSLYNVPFSFKYDDNLSSLGITTYGQDNLSFLFVPLISNFCRRTPNAFYKVFENKSKKIISSSFVWSDSFSNSLDLSFFDDDDKIVYVNYLGNNGNDKVKKLARRKISLE